MTPQDWTNRAMWSAFLEAHTARRLAVTARAGASKDAGR